MQEFLTQVTQLKYLTLDVVELTVRLLAPEEILYQAGQFMQFKIGDQFRSYSIVTPPTGINNESLSFCVKILPSGVGSDFVKALQIGSDVVMRGPLGSFTVQNFEHPIFFIATGVGIAPFSSMVTDMLVRGYVQPVRLLFGLRSEEDVFYYDKFTHLTSDYENFKFIPTLSRPQSHWPGEIGRVTTYISVSYPVLKDYTFYVCGGKEMVMDMRALLLKAGQDPKRIKLEIF